MSTRPKFLTLLTHGSAKTEYPAAPLAKTQALKPSCFPAMPVQHRSSEIHSGFTRSASDLLIACSAQAEAEPGRSKRKDHRGDCSKTGARNRRGRLAMRRSSASGTTQPVDASHVGKVDEPLSLAGILSLAAVRGSLALRLSFAGIGPVALYLHRARIAICVPPLGEAQPAINSDAAAAASATPASLDLSFICFFFQKRTVRIGVSKPCNLAGPDRIPRRLPVDIRSQRAY